MYSEKWDLSFQFPDERPFILIPLVYRSLWLCNLIRHNAYSWGSWWKWLWAKGLGLPTDSTAPPPPWNEAIFDRHVPASFPSTYWAGKHTLPLLGISFRHTLMPLTQSRPAVPCLLLGCVLPALRQRAGHVTVPPTGGGYLQQWAPRSTLCWAQGFSLCALVRWSKEDSRAQDHFLSAASILPRHWDCTYNIVSTFRWREIVLLSRIATALEKW